MPCGTFIQISWPDSDNNSGTVHVNGMPNLSDLFGLPALTSHSKLCHSAGALPKCMLRALLRVQVDPGPPGGQVLRKALLKAAIDSSQWHLVQDNLARTHEQLIQADSIMTAQLTRAREADYLGEL